ncbi:MAG: nitroreductase family protein [Nanoarchaeota archaeon]|nr:nitroreductase family protein [Nanoarchaeota archaeon]MBU4086041.1 nitroreductase family protein [Nanoarchaeota archaeon]
MKFDDIIKERRSVRRFSSKKPKWEDIIEAIDAANKAPLAGNIYALRFILVDDKEKIKEMAEASQQKFIEQANYVFAVCTDKTSLVKSYDERGEIYARQQAGAAIENFLLKIVELGLSSCWVGAFVDDEVKRILEIPNDNENLQVEALLPVGYEMPGHKLKPKDANLDNILWFNKWKNKYMKEPNKPEAF